MSAKKEKAIPMDYSDRKGSLVIYLVLLPFILLFISGLYKSMNRTENLHAELAGTLDSQDLLEEHLPGFFDAGLIKANVDLQKGHKKIIDKTGMVFKGVSQGNVLLDLYVLEMDPDVSYPLNVSKKSLRQGIWIDNMKYRLVSLTKNALRLKIMDAY
jgi:hypothetical protein